MERLAVHEIALGETYEALLSGLQGALWGLGGDRLSWPISLDGKHDSDLKAKIAGDLDRAVKFAALLPEVVSEVIEQAFVKGERLFGLSDQIDALVLQWFSLTAEERADVEYAVAFGRQLLELVRPAPRPASSDDGDVF